MKGFTILEILLSVAMISILVGASVPLYSIYSSRDVVTQGSYLVVNSLYTAKIHSMSGKDDDIWGIYLQSSGVTFYKGESFNLRDASYDYFIDFQEEVSISGINDISFDKKGISSQSGTVTISNQGQEKSITINEEGIIDY